MTPEVLIFQAGLVRAQIRAMGMQAENMQREQNGESMAYTEKDFVYLIEEEGIDYNQAILSARSMY